jgi:hypothetical protein
MVFQFRPPLVLAAVAIVASACAASSGDAKVANVDLASAAGVRDVATRSAATSYRFEATFASEPLTVTGEVVGSTTHTRADLGDVSVECIVDGTTMYLRAPATGLDEAWGKADLGALGEVDQLSADDVQRAIAGGGAYDPAAYIDMLRSVDDVKQIDGLAIRGVDTSGLAAQVELDRARPVPVRLYVGRDRLLRRLEVELPADHFAARVDFFDYGDDLTIELPRHTVDITDDVRELAVR